MSQLLIHAGDFTFQARFEEQLAPKTCAAFRKAMPFESQAIHVRWSGEAVWMPLGALDFGEHVQGDAVGRQARAGRRGAGAR